MLKPMSETIDILYSSDRSLAATTRRGQGVLIEDSYSGFSVCSYSGDGESHYLENRRQLADFIGIDETHIVMPRQTHTSNIAVLQSLPESPESLHEVDAVVTDMKGVAVGVNTADCVAVLLIDETNGICAAVHSGWRGTVDDISGKCVRRMLELGADASAIKAFIPPCIHVECFEVGEEVAELFPREYVNRKYGIKPHIDLVSMICAQLDDCGILHQNISVSKECTRCNPDKYFSARALGIKSGRNFSFTMLKP